MKIAVLGWGSLIWDTRELLLADDAWHADGPMLPVEFARISGIASPPQRLTLVMNDEAAEIRAMWALSSYEDFDAACKNLAAREETIVGNIGYVRRDGTGSSKLKSITNAGVKTRVIAQIEQWRVKRGFDTVIWTDLESNFLAQRGKPLTPPSAVEYLRELIAAGTAESAEEYIRRAPGQVRTAVRNQVEIDLDWLPVTADLGLSSPSIHSADDLRFKDWAECRVTIDRLDKLLEDLRKFGFSLVTTLLAASALIGYSSPTNTARGAAFAAVMILIAALFCVDTFYMVLLSGAVERALDLELLTNPHVRVTRTIEQNAEKTRTAFLILMLYVALFTVAFLLGLVSVLTAASISVAAVAVLAGAFLLLVPTLAYWRFAARASRLHIEKERPWPEDAGLPAPPAPTGLARVLNSLIGSRT